jgi:CheY-like chemotaxis protein
MGTTPEKGRSGSAVDVMVVDDDADTVSEVVDCLSDAKLTCISAGDGWAALELFANGWQPNVVVTDLRMPELNGMEFAERLRQFASAERPEIIFVSGHAGFDDAIAAIRLGARDMLTKPVDGAKLVQAVKSAQLARLVRVRPQDIEAVSSGKAGTPGEPSSLAARKQMALKRLKEMRRLRSRFFPSDLFADPCWEMLLDLYDSSLAGAEITVSSLGIASGVPATTALRRMDTLQSHEMIVRLEDPKDKRRTIVKLTAAGLAAVDRFFETYLDRNTA